MRVQYDMNEKGHVRFLSLMVLSTWLNSRPWFSNGIDMLDPWKVSNFNIFRCFQNNENFSFAKQALSLIPTFSL